MKFIMKCVARGGQLVSASDLQSTDRLFDPPGSLHCDVVQKFYIPINQLYQGANWLRYPDEVPYGVTL